ncbi:MAG: hypothetical protein IPK82_41440 [Polyangiaceae bacterium]|nr:hypothetical protein [Polyangiaceae bacterium]
MLSTAVFGGIGGGGGGGGSTGAVAEACTEAIGADVDTAGGADADALAEAETTVVGEMVGAERSGSGDPAPMHPNIVYTRQRTVTRLKATRI